MGNGVEPESTRDPAPLCGRAGGLVFPGTDKGNFFALDAETGKPLWEIYLGSSLRSNPVTYAVDSRQSCL
ncbi:MAG TPA: hypothetical protein VMB02_10670 [Candidatus Aquilonibacter sp.]|nr:hypothetical protein [Candidatus Aquilonibacter sp.]